MKRKPRKPQRKDSPVLEQLAKLIDVRLPDQHGFALLTFPLGAAVDPVMRYVGKGDRDGILTAMQAWIDQQREKGKGYWGRHDMAPPETQWTSIRPTAPGLYLLKHARDEYPSYINIRDDEATGALMLFDWNGDQWAASFDELADLSDEHIWLGPIPQPWNLGLQTVAEPEPESKQPPEWFADAHAAAVAKDQPDNVVQIADSRPEDFFENIVDKHHGEPMAEMLENLLRGIPKEGGHASKESIAATLRCAFVSGVHAQFCNPLPEAEPFTDELSKLVEARDTLKQRAEQMKAGKHVQAEAFMLMKYQSADGSITETLWNSRDGVTPFCIMAKDGKTELRHVDWQLDRYAPDHKPASGDRIFATITREAAERYAAKRMDSAVGTEYELKGDERKEMEARLVESFMNDDCPDIITVP